MLAEGEGRYKGEPISSYCTLASIDMNMSSCKRTRNPFQSKALTISATLPQSNFTESIKPPPKKMPSSYCVCQQGCLYFLELMKVVAIYIYRSLTSEPTSAIIIYVKKAFHIRSCCCGGCHCSPRPASSIPTKWMVVQVSW